MFRHFLKDHNEKSIFNFICNNIEHNKRNYKYPN